jgi:hypothetical protein
MHAPIVSGSETADGNERTIKAEQQNEHGALKAQGNQT